MGDNDTNAGAQDGNNVDASTQQNPSEPSADYKGLQRKLSEKDNTIKELAARVRELEPKPSLEDELARERAARAQLEREVALERTKAKAPELASAIEAIVAETGKVPSEEVLNAIRGASQTAGSDSSSFGRNNPARPAMTESQKMDEVLKNATAF